MTERPQIIISHWVHPEVEQLLGKFGDVIANRTLESWPRDELLAKTRRAQALIAFMPDRIDEEFLAACPKLRVVAGAFKGSDNVDIAACSRRKIWVAVVPDLLTEPVAELALTLTLALLRNVLEGDRKVREGKFTGWRPVLYGHSLSGAQVGLIGLGAIGMSIAKKVAAFGTSVRYYDPWPASLEAEAKLGISLAPLDELLKWGGVFILAAPLMPSTINLINAGRLAQMHPGSFLINVGRGSLVDEEAVAAALSSGHLAGYASDVFAFEDLSRPDRPAKIPECLLGHNACTVFTPHLGSAVNVVRRRIALCAADNVIDLFQGRSPRHAVNYDLALQGSGLFPRPSTAELK